MNKKFWIALVIFVIFFVGLAIAGMVTLGGVFGGVSKMTPSPAFHGGRDKVALIYIEGTILGDSSGVTNFFAGQVASSVEIVEILEEARKDKSVKSVVLRVNSPGGSAAASQEIYNAIMKVRKEKPVVVSMGDLAASGGYFVSSAADWVFANPATLTGSIGVIVDALEVSELLEKIGVTPQTLKAGEFKDILSPWRKMTDKERVMLQEMIRGIHKQFIKAVAEGRKMDEEKVRALATGAIMTGEQAKNNGLVDELGGLEDAKAKARELAKLPEDAPVVPFKKKPSIFDIFRMFGGESGVLSKLSHLKASSSNGKITLGSLARQLFSADLSVFLN